MRGVTSIIAHGFTIEEHRRNIREHFKAEHSHVAAPAGGHGRELRQHACDDKRAVLQHQRRVLRHGLDDGQHDVRQLVGARRGSDRRADARGAGVDGLHVRNEQTHVPQERFVDDAVSEHAARDEM